MATFNVERARRAGMPEAEIQQFMKEQGLSPTKTVSGFLQNIPKSAGALVSGIGEAITNPQTLINIGNVAMGAAQLVMPGKQDKEKFAIALGQFYVDRYGSPEKALDTLYLDPVGALSDVSTFLTGGGAAISAIGKVSKLGGVAKTGQAVSKIGAMAEPLNIFGKGAKMVGKKIPLPSMKSVGEKIEQFGKEYALRGIRPSQSSITKFGEKFKMPLEDFVAKANLTVDQLEELRNPAVPTSQTSVLKPLYDQRRKLIESRKTELPVREVYMDIAGEINRLRSGTKADVPDAQKLATQLEDYLTSYMENKMKAGKKTISLSELDDLRSEFDRATREAEFLQSPDTGFNRQMGDIFRTIVNDKAGTTDVGRKIQKLESFAQIARKSPSGKGNIPLGLGTGVYMGAVESVPFVGPLVTAGIREVINAPKTVQRVSQATRKIGQAMQKGMPKMPVLEKAGQGANIFYQAGKVGRVTAPAGKTETMPTMTPEEEKQKRIDDAILRYAPSYEKIKQKRTQVSPGNAFSKVSKVSKGSFV